jgi:hypothetical protein
VAIKRLTPDIREVCSVVTWKPGRVAQLLRRLARGLLLPALAVFSHGGLLEESSDRAADSHGGPRAGLLRLTAPVNQVLLASFRL